MTTPQAASDTEALDNASIGTLAWHCSEEGSGPDVGVSIKLADNEMLWLGEITKKTRTENDCPGDDFGWWVIHYRGESAVPIARCWDADASREVFERVSQIMLTFAASERAAGVREGLEMAAGVMRGAIATGYPEPTRKGDTCGHGVFGWEGCIACYDIALEAAIAGMLTAPQPQS